MYPMCKFACQLLNGRFIDTRFRNKTYAHTPRWIRTCLRLSTNSAPSPTILSLYRLHFLLFNTFLIHCFTFVKKIILPLTLDRSFRIRNSDSLLKLFRSLGKSCLRNFTIFGFSGGSSTFSTTLLVSIISDVPCRILNIFTSKLLFLQFLFFWFKKFRNITKNKKKGRSWVMWDSIPLGFSFKLDAHV